jgi:2,5-diamino-6-(ribosylamino)-4(3H)-pyrimidinone 5'-phosphate reductase
MKPYIICHMCTSIDGKILTDRWGKLPGGMTASRLFETTAASFNVGAWLVGTTTMDEFDAPKFKLPRSNTRVRRQDHISNQSARNLAVGADAKGVLRFKAGEVDGDHLVLLLTQRVSNDYLAHLQRAGASYLFCGKTRVDPRVAVRKLGNAFHLRKLMVQGGGTFNGAMLKAGLISEISQIVVPIVDGGAGISGVFDIPGATPRKAAATLQLISRKSMAGSVTWLRYRIVAAHAA